MDNPFDLGRYFFQNKLPTPVKEEFVFAYFSFTTMWYWIMIGYFFIHLFDKIFTFFYLNLNWLYIYISTFTYIMYICMHARFVVSVSNPVAVPFYYSVGMWFDTV